MPSQKCSVCGTPAHQACSNCGKEFYCSKQHQIEHWKSSHSTICIPYKIKENEKFGRYVVAKRNISAGEIIMKKKPLVIAPKLASKPVCLGCHKPLHSNVAFYKCTKCNWPLCGKKCEETYYHKEECKILVQSNLSVPPLNCEAPPSSAFGFIGPLRVLILKDLDKSKYEQVVSMQDHLTDQQNSTMFMAIKIHIVPIVKTAYQKHCNEEDILRICSIFDTNAFDLRYQKEQINVRALYPVISLLAHDCTQNTAHYFVPEEEFSMCLIATVPIKKGSLITTTYTQTLWSSLFRRIHLKKTKNFQCTCQRCADPTELQTYCGSFYCNQCISHKTFQGNISVNCPKLVSTKPIDNNAPWQCEECGYKETAQEIFARNQKLKVEIETINKSTTCGLEEFLENHKNDLPPNNSFMTQVKHALVEMYGSFGGTKINDLSNSLLKRKIELLDELSVGEILEPGVSEFNVLRILNVIEAAAEKARRDFISKKINETSYRECIQDLQVKFNSTAQGPRTEKIVNRSKEVMEFLAVLKLCNGN